MSFSSDNGFMNSAFSTSDGSFTSEEMESDVKTLPIFPNSPLDTKINTSIFASPSNTYPSPTRTSPLSQGQSNQTPSLAASTHQIFKSKEKMISKPKNCTLITAVEAGKIIESTTIQDELLILDLRPFTDYSKSCIRSAIHICLPSTLLRRKNFTLDKLIENLTPLEQNVLSEKCAKNNLKIILYDNVANQRDDSISTACNGIIIKLSNYQEANNIKYNISILASGFRQFELLFPGLVSFNILPIDHQASVKHAEMNLSLQMPNSKNTGPNISRPSACISSKDPNAGMNNYGSPVSSSSPLSALFKFQLPPPPATPSTLFKFAQNEEVMNLESYLSAVNIKEEHERLQSQKNDYNIPLDTFEFPKRSYPTTSNSIHASPSTVRARSTLDKYKDKLAVQIKFEEFLNEFREHTSNEDFDQIVPKWYQNLMQRRKIQFISQYQKLDLLERRRLNNSLSSRKKNRKFMINYEGAHNGNLTTSSSSSTSEVTEKDFVFTKPSSGNYFTNEETAPLPKRSYSQPNCGVLNKEKWLCTIDSDEDSDDDKVEISSGLELGFKNRYKDIFPYEHSRVVLKKRSVSSISAMFSSKSTNSSPLPFTSATRKKNNTIDATDQDTSDENTDISENYINANYLKLPELALRHELLSEYGNKNSEVQFPENVQYIATQAPMQSTIDDFFTCILNNNVPLIISLTNDIESGVEKCFRYWKDAKYNDVEIELLEEVDVSSAMKPDDVAAKDMYTFDDDGGVILRRIRIIYNIDQSFETLQLQIKDWPDLGTLNPLAILKSLFLKHAILNRLIENNISSKDQDDMLENKLLTILVHCSAGCGRTGTWCTIDSIMTNLEKFDLLQNDCDLTNGKLFDPISWTINTFRKQRISMVQNINQFLSIYDCLLCFFKLKFNDTRPRTHGEESFSSIVSQAAKLDIVSRFVNSKRTEVRPLFA
ncbi:tyrosine protein phosphatase PTP3 NDAI_0A03150 [Naumovozyma dairenensis CBS 421]|uniref:protein-tyrosine-phosphatase n=1 Tax=Naumovozyma dairenensis (strain ATCC 10597 / BCRC 20456 / CBS 421 / NBRC 0211 / NRRL Y-12639) TaxID=1071378 RepID=G0W3T4_NAUDC|nr:hypothetical protein NDAI_0A03150 [Naumovozyma dairenensis CBS 421]CCD22472.1 hypothetical protein NDAI_0A03150 [Naumovozyma dairenensis CBS 421]